MGVLDRIVKYVLSEQRLDQYTTLVLGKGKKEKNTHLFCVKPEIYCLSLTDFFPTKNCIETTFLHE